MAEIFQYGDRAALFQGDCVESLKLLNPESVHSVITDPPAGIGFMNKTWDSDKGGRDQWVAWLAGVLREAMRVLKPGGHALVWALPRTSHWTATALEDAGMEVRDVVMHLFGTGFPKSLNISKAMDAAAGWAPAATHIAEDAHRWGGWGTALKPAAEHWILARKPFETTVAKNVIAHDTGGLNIDACRIGGNVEEMRGRSGGAVAENSVYQKGVGQEPGTIWEPNNSGRWPANVCLSHVEGGCRLVGTKDVSANGAIGKDTAAAARADSVAMQAHDVPRGEWKPHGNGDGTETVEVWECVEGCAVAVLDAQSGVLKSGAWDGNRNTPKTKNTFGTFDGRQEAGKKGDSGGASRFFYVAKPSRSERDAGCELLPVKSGAEATDREDGQAGLQNPRAGAGRGGGARNHHPTVKSIALMRWLIRLITPPGGTVLDLFMGSGSTGVAALAEGFDFAGMEQDPEYMKIAQARISHALKENK